MTRAARARYAGYRFPAEIISHAVWLYFRFPLGLRMVEELLAARGIIVSRETVRQWARKFGQRFANQIRRRLPRVGGKWHLDEVALKIAGVKHRLWRAVDQTGVVLDVLVHRRRDKQAAKRLFRKLLKKQMRPPRVMITDKLASYGAAKREGVPADRAHRAAEHAKLHAVQLKTEIAVCIGDNVDIAVINARQDGAAARAGIVDVQVIDLHRIVRVGISPIADDRAPPARIGVDVQCAGKMQVEAGFWRIRVATRAMH